MEVLIPIIDIQEVNSKPIAVFILRIDPYQFLFPLIQTWPGDSQSGETLLFRPQGDSLVYLNSLRFEENTALKLKYPINDPDLPAAMVIRGSTGVIQGIDYRGIPVIAVGRKIPSSNWYLIAKQDTSEAYADIRNQGWTLFSVLTLVIAVFGWFGFTFLRKSRLIFEKEVISAEADTQRIRRSYELLFEMANDVIIVLDGTGNITDVNDRAVAIYGYTQAELLEMNGEMLRTPEKRTQFSTVLEEVKKSGGKRFESTHLKKDGTTFPVEISMRYYQEGEEGPYLSIIRDISSQKNNEIILKENINALESIINTSPLAIITTDLDGNVTLWSREAEKIFGWTQEELVGKTIPYFPENVNENSDEIRQKLLTSKAPLFYEAVRKCKDGKLVTVNVTAVLLKDYRDEVKGMMAILTDITELKKIQAVNEQMVEERSRLLKRLRLQFERMPIGFIITDDNLNILDWNPQAEKIFGYTREEALGKSQYDLILPKDQKKLVGRVIRQAIQGNQTESITHENVTKEGRRIIVEWHNTSLWDENGDLIALMAMAMDVTDKVEAERQLIASEEKLRALFDSKLIGIQFGNIDGRIYSGNDEMLRIIGYENTPLIFDQLRWDDLTPDPFLELDKTAIKQAIKNGSCEPYEKQYLRKDGSLVWVLLKFVIIDKKLGDTIAFVLDITEKKKAEQEYRDYEELLSLVGSIGKIGGWEFDVATGAGTWTDEVARIHDLDPEIQTNKEIGLSYYTPESRKVIEKAIQQAIEQRVPYDLELELVSAKGIHKLVRTSGQPQIIDGKVVKLRGIFHDITELKRAEEEVRKLNEELEERVKERTAELTAANQELEAFSYSVSHDLRAPIRAIDGFSQILMDDYRDSLIPETLRYLQIIRSNTHSMGQLVDDLLAFSKLGRQSVQKQNVKMKNLVNQVVDETKLQIQGREVEFRINKLNDAWGDENLLRQAIFNLIANAVKFTRNCAHAVIEIGMAKCEPHLPDGSRAEMCQCYFIRDNGVGFDMRYYDKLFNVFHRLHKAEEFEGTGVGLAIVKRVVEKHGGKVWAESILGSGTTFYFTLGEEKTNDKSS